MRLYGLMTTGIKIPLRPLAGENPRDGCGTWEEWRIFNYPVVPYWRKFGYETALRRVNFVLAN